MNVNLPLSLTLSPSLSSFPSLAGWHDAVHQLNKDETAWLQLPKPPKIASTQKIPLQRHQFEADPSGYLQTLFKINNKVKWPRSIVGFSGTMGEVAGVLGKYGYREKTRLWNCLVPVDGNNECGVSIFEREQKSAVKFFS